MRMHVETLPGCVRQNNRLPECFPRNFGPSMALLHLSLGVLHLMLYFGGSVSVHVLRCMRGVW